jgi:rhomboid protease GluP
METTRKNNVPYITIAIVIANVVVYAICQATGSWQDTSHMIDMGAMYEPLFLDAHEYYRIITHFFLHFGLEHLGNNMFSLVILGYALESQMGRVKYLSIYFLSGILAGVTSLLYNMYTGEFTVSCGASGAIYGLMGALLAILLFDHRRRDKDGIPRYVFCIAISLYSGLTDPSINNAAHVGGLISGFIFCAVIIFVSKKIRRQVSNES